VQPDVSILTDEISRNNNAHLFESNYRNIDFLYDLVSKNQIEKCKSDAVVDQ